MPTYLAKCKKCTEEFEYVAKITEREIIPLAPSAMERLRKRGQLPKVVLSLKEAAGINLVVSERNVNLEVIGNKVYMDTDTFNTLFKMSTSRAKTPQGKRYAVKKVIEKALKLMMEEYEALQEMENDDAE